MKNPMVAFPQTLLLPFGNNKCSKTVTLSLNFLSAVSRPANSTLALLICGDSKLISTFLTTISFILVSNAYSQ